MWNAFFPLFTSVPIVADLQMVAQDAVARDVEVALPAAVQPRLPGHHLLRRARHRGEDLLPRRRQVKISDTRRENICNTCPRSKTDPELGLCLERIVARHRHMELVMKTLAR